jgi:hypothetical protein
MIIAELKVTIRICPRTTQRNQVWCSDVVMIFLNILPQIYRVRDSRDCPLQVHVVCQIQTVEFATFSAWQVACSK